MTRPAYDPTKIYRLEVTAFPWTEAAAVDANVVTIEDEDATDTLQSAAAAAIAAAGLAGSGGAYTQTVTVTSDGSTAIPNATVAIYSGSVLIDTKTTDADGIAQPTCDAGNYTLRVTATGYASYSAALAVTGDATVPTITLTAITSPASTDPDSVTVRWRVKKADRSWAGSAEATVYIQIVEGPDSDGVIWHGDNENFDGETTDASGYVNFTNVPVPCTLAVRTGTSRKIITVDIPADATSPYDAGEIVSQDA